ncbi:hypothetical protein GCM10023224_05530 [Streptomonospora halophila]|uniref:GIY-YIG domain-containing protein n=1 Tax=Streptomonospora halophila TaxID=427369 RepID=A0ABP9G6Y2_9ACTN
MSKRTALYRAFAADGALLYVGISTNPRHRWNEHALEKNWWRREVHRTEVVWFETRLEAATAEARAVRAERPARNRALPAEDGSSRYQLITPKPKAPDSRKGPVTTRRRRSAGERKLRTSDDLWERFAAAVERSPDPEADMSKVLRSFVRWYVGEPGAELPRRPES